MVPTVKLGLSADVVDESPHQHMLARHFRPRHGLHVGMLTQIYGY